MKVSHKPVGVNPDRPPRGFIRKVLAWEADSRQPIMGSYWRGAEGAAHVEAEPGDLVEYGNMASFRHGKGDPLFLAYAIVGSDGTVQGSMSRVDAERWWFAKYWDRPERLTRSPEVLEELRLSEEACVTAIAAPERI